MHQLILTKSGGPHPYVDPAREKVDPQDPVAPRPVVMQYIIIFDLYSRTQN